MKKPMLRNAVVRSLSLSEELRKSLTGINRYIVYKGLGGSEEPKAAMCNEEEIILCYHNGKHMDIETAIGYMESQGYVDIEDFHY